jgi:hypothetical protein
VRADRGKPGRGAATLEGTTAPRGRLPRPGRHQPQAPEPSAMRPLARALVDLALALTREQEEDKRWTR